MHELSSGFKAKQSKKTKKCQPASLVDMGRAIRQDLWTMNIRRQSLEARIEKIKEEIARLGDLRPGALSQQYNACGSPRCRCKEDPSRRHGPFYQLSYTWHSKSTTRHVRKDDVVQVKQQLRNYRKLRKLVDRWVTLGMELSRLRLQEQHEARPGATKRKRESQLSAENKA